MRKAIALLALLGTLFSGFLTAQFFLSGTCSAGCAFLFGLPTCAYGFVMFLLLLLFALIRHPQSREIIMVVAGAGTIFSLWYAVQELAVCWTCYPLGLPNCVYGLVMYAAILLLAWRGRERAVGHSRNV